MIWQHGEEKLKEFLKTLNSCHPTIKFTAEYSLDKVNFLDVEVIRNGSTPLIDLYIKLTDTRQYLQIHLVTYIILKNLFHVARLSVLIGFVQKIGFLIIDVINLSAGLKIEVTIDNLIDEGCNKQETRKKNFFGNISLTHLYRIVLMSK